mgnify:CR=1 FL=1
MAWGMSAQESMAYFIPVPRFKVQKPMGLIIVWLAQQFEPANFPPLVMSVLESKSQVTMVSH